MLKNLRTSRWKLNLPNWCQRKVKNFVSIKNRTLDDFTPIHFAVMYGNKEAMQLLFQHGGKLESVSSIGRRPIHIVAIKGYLSIMEFLIE